MHIIILFTFILTSSQLSQAQPGYCDAVICLPNQFCDTDRCTWQYSLGESCRGRGQCLQTNSDCMDDGSGSMTCQCNANFVQSKDKCVQGCSADAECNIFSRGSFCHAQLKGCLDQVDLNQGCDDTAGDSQCKTEKASCSEERCQCGPIFAEKNGICIDRCTSDNGLCSAAQYCENESGLCRTKSSLGGSCTSGDQCLPTGSECNEDTCKCSLGLGFVEYYGSCLPSCTPGSCDPGQYCALPWSITGMLCFPQSGLNQQCFSRTDDTPCSDAEADCIDGLNLSAICECKSAFVEKDGSCQKACDPAEDCQSGGEFCNTETRLCEVKRGLGETCFTPENNSECSGPNAICRSASNDEFNLRCTCSDGFLEFGGTCVAKCTSSIKDCSDQPGQYCNTGFGVCSPKIELSGLCNPAGDEDQCKTELTKCKPETSTCSCDGDLIEDLSSLSCVAKCKVTNDCGDREKYCNPTTGGCLSRIPLNRDCIGEFEDECITPDAECYDVEDKNQTMVCTCKGGFIERGNSCIAKCTDALNDCNSNEFCNTESGQCQSKVELGNGCAADDQCSSAASECLGDEGDKRCKCKEDYVQWVNTCIGRCDVVDQCEQKQYCDTGTGLCNQKKVLNKDCSESYECLNNNAVCQETTLNRKICSCDTSNGYLEDRALCIANCTREAVCDSNLEFCSASSGKCANRQPIHYSCTSYGSPEQCLGNYVTCKDKGECSCEDIAIESMDAKRCLKLAEKLGEECEEGRQCLPLDVGGQNLTDCVSDLCGCNPDKAVASIDTTKCLKLAMTLGEECEEPQQCTPVGAGNAAITDCQTGACACKLDVAIESSDSKRCLKLANALGEQCEDPAQCFPLGNEGKNTTDCASNSQCTCTSTSILSEGRCYVQKLIGTTCSNTKECSVGIEGSVECDTTSKICSCPAGNTIQEDKKACILDKSGAASVVFSIFTLLFCLLLTTG